MEGGHEVNGLKQDDLGSSLSPHTQALSEMMASQQQQWGAQHHYPHYHHQQQHQQPQQQQGWSNQGSWSPGMPGVELTDEDIVISTGLEHSRSREGNLEYQRLLMANSVLFGSLPAHYQNVHAQHLYHFLTHVRGRRFLQCIAPNVYVPFQGGPYQIAQEITGDPCKMAFQSRNPLWMLEGMQTLTTSAEPATEVRWAHRLNPRGNEWETVSLDRVKEILRAEGPVHLIVLPPGIEIKSAASVKEENDDAEGRGDEGVRDTGKGDDLNGEGGHDGDDSKSEEQHPPQPDDEEEDHDDGPVENVNASDALGTDEETDNIIGSAEQVMGDLDHDQTDIEQTLAVSEAPPFDTSDAPAIVGSTDSIDETDTPKRTRTSPEPHENGTELDLERHKKARS